MPRDTENVCLSGKTASSGMLRERRWCVFPPRETNPEAGSWQGLDVAARCLLLSRLLRDSLPNWGTRRRESSMSKPGLDGRHRNKDGEISGKHGNTLVRTLRKVYGQGFAAGYPETAKLLEVMFHLNETSLSQLRRDHETDHLEHKIAQASK